MKMNKSKKFRLGTTGIVFTVIVLAIVIILNASIYALAGKFNLFADMSKEKVWGLSESAVDILNKVKEDNPDAEVSIKFCAPADKLQENEFLKYVYQTARSLEEKFDYISLDFLDLAGDPAAFAPYMTTAGSEIVSTSVIVTSGDQYRVKAIRSFFTFTEEDQSNPYAYDGEYTFVSTILQMVYAGQKAYFTSGHGEATASSALYNLFEKSGFECITVDLKTDDFDEGGGVIVINNPRYDFAADDNTTNEIKKIDRFLDDKGNLMVFTDPEWVRSLTNLNEYLTEWGIEISGGQIRDYSHTISTDGYSLVANYSSEDDGSTLHSALRALDSTPTVIFENASPINIIWDSGSRDARHVSPVFTTFEDALLFNVSENSDRASESGLYNLMTISQEEYVVDSQRFYSTVLVASSSHFTDEKYLNGNAFGNSDILYSVMRVCGQSNTPANLDFKVFDDHSIVIEKSAANGFTVFFSAIIPAAVLIIGGVVAYRRKRR